MNRFPTVPTLAALAVISVLSACGRDQNPPPPSTSSSTTTITPPAAPATPPSSTTPGSTTTPGTTPGSASSGASGSGGSSSSDTSTGSSGTGMGSGTSGMGSGSSSTGTGSTGSSATGTGTDSSSTGRSSGSSGSGTSGSSSSSSGRTSSLDGAGATLAALDAAALRQAYGVEVSKVADTTTSSASKSSAMNRKTSRGDRGFIKEAAVDGMYEVEAAQIAARQASDPEIKAFAERLVKDHSAANDELKQLASARNIELDSKLPMTKRRAVDNLSKESGSEFDRDFITKAGIKDHESDIKKFEKASRDADDPEVRAWAQKILPTLREHLSMAQNLADGSSRGSSAMKGGSGSMSRSSESTGSSMGSTGSTGSNTSASPGSSSGTGSTSRSSGNAPAGGTTTTK